MSREYPDRPFVGVGVVVWRGDEVLLIERGKGPRTGGWSLPGGKQELGETVRETAHREIREETAVEIEITGLLDVVDMVRKDGEGRVQFHYTLVDFTAEWVSGEAVAGTDAAAARWVRLEDIDQYRLWDETRRVIRLSASRR
ncbi:MAG: NUDIX domain-containing protein [Alphaproteobacteria bacterium]|nr:NUDIX domain-containing protein [Alphaproteobacteria bacterium]